MRDMDRRTALVAPLAALVFGLPARAEILPLAELSAYLNGLTTAEAEFTQTNADGSQSSGKLFIKRPWRAAGRWRSSMPSRTSRPSNTR